jgi:hypothetical protein
MIISDTHRFIYIGIPRTGSKSMNHWLCEHFDGRNCGGHHDYVVPEEASDYFIFTVVRNPYDRKCSGHFAVTWDDQGTKDHELAECKSPQERLRKIRAILKSREKQKQKEMPRQSPIPLEQRSREAVLNGQGKGKKHSMNQAFFVDKAAVNMVLFFERLPECLAELPFVDKENIPRFPHHPERGIRPSGNFFDFFRDTDEEQVVWAHNAEDFEAFGYRRFDPGLPEDAPNALRIE